MSPSYKVSSSVELYWGCSWWKTRPELEIEFRHLKIPFFKYVRYEWEKPRNEIRQNRTKNRKNLTQLKKTMNAVLLRLYFFRSDIHILFEQPFRFRFSVRFPILNPVQQRRRKLKIKIVSYEYIKQRRVGVACYFICALVLALVLLYLVSNVLLILLWIYFHDIFGLNGDEKVAVCCFFNFKILHRLWFF